MLKILLVEDIGSLRRQAKGLLLKQEHSVVDVEDAPSAVAAFGNNESKFDVIVTDLRLGDQGDALQIISSIRSRYPDFPIMVVTSDLHDWSAALADAEFRQSGHAQSIIVLKKPYSEKMFGENLAILEASIAYRRSDKVRPQQMAEATP